MDHGWGDVGFAKGGNRGIHVVMLHHVVKIETKIHNTRSSPRALGGHVEELSLEIGVPGFVRLKGIQVGDFGLVFLIRWAVNRDWRWWQLALLATPMVVDLVLCHLKEPGPQTAF